MLLNWIDQAPRRVLALISVACVAMLAFGMYLQHVVGLEPCPMCIVQRYALIGVAIFTGLASARASKGWWMGWGAHKAVDKWRHSPTHLRALQWLEKLGPRACLLSWLPGVGDPLCAVAGWLQMPLWPCTFYMAIGKFLRYLLMTSALLWVF